MSKSLKRVRGALAACGLADTVRETGLARTAADAAAALDCAVDQIAKSIIFADEAGGVVLFITAGGNQVDAPRAAELAGGTLGRAEAGLIRQVTGFAIGGVAPVGHLTPPRAFFDRRLLDFTMVWAAAGTPHHVFSAAPQALAQAASAQITDFTV